MKTQKHSWLFPLMAGFLFIALMSGCGTKPAPVTDIDGNVYKTVIIGEQEWFAENLKTTRYNDGSAIPNITDNDEWGRLSTDAYCWYDNVAGNGAIYGALYNWHAVNTGKLCPEGWRVPTEYDWIKLTGYLGGGDIAGGKLKATGTLEAGDGLWYDPNEGATNETGFSALLGGCRFDSGGYTYIGDVGLWWSSSEYSSTSAWYWGVNSYDGYVSRDIFHKKGGFSVRCLRDDPTNFDGNSLLNEHLFKNDHEEENPFDYLEIDFIEEEDIPITRQEVPPPGYMHEITIFEDEEENKEEVIYTVAEVNPEYPGGEEARQQFLRDNLIYPERARDAGIQGTVFVTFVVEKDGSITDVRIIRGIGGGCDEEAVRVVRMMPRWEPGRQRGQPVRVQFNMPIRFRLH